MLYAKGLLVTSDGGTYALTISIGYTMAHALRELFEEGLKPISAPKVEAQEGVNRRAMIKDVERFEKLCAARAQKLRRDLMSGRAGVISALSSGPLAAALRSEHRVFGRYAKATLQAQVETLQVRAESAEMFARLAGASLGMPQSDRQFLGELMKRYDRAMELQFEAQGAMADFFNEASEVAQRRFEHLTTDPNAYDDYVDEVVRENPTIISRLAG